jgi:hypothetical protein
VTLGYLADERDETHDTGRPLGEEPLLYSYQFRDRKVASTLVNGGSTTGLIREHDGIRHWFRLNLPLRHRSPSHCY